MNWPFGKRPDPVKSGIDAARSGGHVDTSGMTHQQKTAAETARKHELERMQKAAANK